MDFKPKLLELLECVHKEEQHFIESLTETERLAPGTPQRWAAKDILSHLAAWNHHDAQELACASWNRPPLSDAEILSANAGYYEQSCSRSWFDVVQDLAQAHQELVATVEGFSEEDLVDPQKCPWENGPLLWRAIAGNCFSHPLTHLSQAYLERGDTEYARQMEETWVQMLKRLDPSDAWQGVVVYNMACFYAQSGQIDQALEQLRLALRLRPDLVEWSQQDPDLAALRQESAYQAIYRGGSHDFETNPGK